MFTVLAMTQALIALAVWTMEAHMANGVQGQYRGSKRGKLTKLAHDKHSLINANLLETDISRDI